MRSIIIADRQEITNAGIRYLIDTLVELKDVVNVLSVSDKKTLIQSLSEYPNGIILLDYTLFDFSSITEIQILSEKYIESSWILFSDELSDSFLRQMLMNDLSLSIVFKSSSLEEIGIALKSALVYQTYLTKSLETHLISLKRSIDNISDNNLTLTEKEILKEMALGKTTKEIAAGRNVSFHTIMTHRKNIFRKLDVNNVHEATRYAMRAGIVDLSEYYI